MTSDDRQSSIILAGVFGLLATLMAGIGLYGVMAYTVARQTREIGIRMALGAEPARVLWLVLRETLLLFLAGAAVGNPTGYRGYESGAESAIWDRTC